MSSNFVKHIEENIYKKELIYRSILVVKSNIDGYRLKTFLDNRDYTSQFVKNIDNDIEYNNIDCRILIMCTNMFKDFVNFLDLQNGINNSTYNFIGFDYSLDAECVNDLVSFYTRKTNNMTNTIILDKSCVFV
jgi:hypothetical protein